MKRGSLKYSIQNVKIFLKENYPGSECVSDVYTGIKDVLKIKCELGHCWETNFDRLKNSNRWCPYCARNVKHSLQDIDAILNEKYSGTIRINDLYQNENSDIELLCPEQHEYTASFVKLRDGDGKCPFCFTKMEFFSSIAAVQKLLNEKYPGAICVGPVVSDKKHKSWIVRCENNHEWITRVDTIKSKHWCPNCYLSKVKSTLDDVNNFIDDNFPGGKCLENEYIGVDDPMLIECRLGHQWKTNFSNLRAKHWCPICQSSFGEKITRFCFEYFFGYKFSKIKPDWLKNHTGYNLELDGYCSELNIAFEYQGDQHYKIVDFFCNNQEILENQQKRDQFKRDRCSELGIFLFEIPQYKNLFEPPNLIIMLIEKCIINKIKLPDNYQEKVLDMRKFYENN